jgi:hypothetical protein
LQAEFVALYSWMKPLYFTGALLAMAGTLYGTIEVAPAVFRELLAALEWGPGTDAARWRRWAVLWPAVGGLVILAAGFVYLQSGAGKSLPGLVSLLTPANLFTGVLACGVICLLNPWSEKRLLPEGLRMGLALKALNWLAAGLFIAAGCKAYWDHSQWKSLAILAGTLGLAVAAAHLLQRPAVTSSPPRAPRKRFPGC